VRTPETESICDWSREETDVLRASAERLRMRR
jgi:hypothetical protein